MSDARCIDDAIRVLQAGGVVLLPTDTVYGLAADPANPAAVRKLFEAKDRAEDKPVALLAAAVSDVARFGCLLTPYERILAASYWPGPLTLVLETPIGPEGFRVPDSEVAREVLRGAGGVLRVTSANVSGGTPARTVSEAMAALAGHIDYVLDGGPIRGGVPSTVVRLDGRHICVLRQGALALDELEARVAHAQDQDVQDG